MSIPLSKILPLMPLLDVTPPGPPMRGEGFAPLHLQAPVEPWVWAVCALVALGLAVAGGVALRRR